MQPPKLPVFTEPEILSRIADVRTDQETIARLETSVYEAQQALYDEKQRQGIATTGDKPEIPYQWHGAEDEKEKSEALDAVMQVSDAPIRSKVSIREHEQDGVGHESDKTYLFSIDEGVFVFSIFEDRRDFGWSGSRPSKRYHTIVGTAAGDAPLVNAAYHNNLLNNFTTGSWSTVKSTAEEIRFALDWHDLIGRLGSLVGAYGEIIELDNAEGVPTDRPKKQSLQVRFEDEAGTSIVALGNRFHGYDPLEDEDEMPPYTIVYRDKLMKNGIHLSVPQDNIIPIIWQSPMDERGRHSITKANWLQSARLVVSRLESHVV